MNGFLCLRPIYYQRINYEIDVPWVRLCCCVNRLPERFLEEKKFIHGYLERAGPVQRAVVKVQCLRNDRWARILGRGAACAQQSAISCAQHATAKLGPAGVRALSSMWRHIVLSPRWRRVRKTTLLTYSAVINCQFADFLRCDDFDGCDMAGLCGCHAITFLVF